MGAAAAAAMAGSLSRLACAEAETAQPVAGIARSARGAGAAVRPLRVHATDAQLADLRRRIDATRWLERETVADASPARAFRRPGCTGGTGSTSLSRSTWPFRWP